MELDFASGADLAALLHDGAVTSVELTEQMLERIDARNAALNAVVTVEPEAAMREAAQRDTEQRLGNIRGPLHGIPMTVKDAFATAGMRTTAGMSDLADNIPHADAVAVTRLRAAGAVIVGKTNCPAGVTGQETANELFGVTRNPWDLQRTPGGSSGGAAAALAAGLTPLELGSDKGGSIRQPASFCGVFGHCTSQGLVPVRGHLPSIDVSELDVHSDLYAVGPLARTAADLDVMLSVLAGPDTIGARAWRTQLPPPSFGDPTELRVAVWTDDDDFPVDGEVVAALQRAASALEGAGATVDRTRRPSFSLLEAERVGFDLWVSDSADSLDDDQFAEQARRGANRNDDSRSARRARASTMTHRDWLRLDERRRALQRGWEELFTTVDVLLCPVTPVVAYPHDARSDLVHDMDHRLALTIDVNGTARPYLDQLVWPTAVGLGRLPATVAPVGLTPSGLPVGAQIVSGAFRDRTTIAVAALLERVLGGFSVPPWVTELARAGDQTQSRPSSP